MPDGLTFYWPLCHKEAMDELTDLDARVQEIYSRVVEAILNRIKELERLELGQTEIGLRCGFEQGTISRYIRKARNKNLPFKSVLALAIGLGVDLPELLKTYGSKEERLKALLSEVSKIVANG